MENNKYFTPDIEDFHVGYEYERFVPRANTTEKECWEKLVMSVNYLSLDDIDNEIIEKEIRVPYLTKEQIEAEGWEEMNAPIMSIGYGFLYIPFLKNNCRLDYNYTTNILNIKKDDVTNLYYGECKDINTFRKIIKLLEI